MHGRVAISSQLAYRRVTDALQHASVGGQWLFAWVLLAQIGHLIEHIAVKVIGTGLLGTSFDNEWSHFLFNGVIAIAAIVLIAVYPRNPWVYPLGVLAVFHGFEHVYILREFLATGVSNGPGILGLGGVIGLIPLVRMDLHNVYNGFEAILMVLGFGHQVQSTLAEAD